MLDEIFEQGVALKDNLLVGNELLQVFLVKLRDDHIEKSPPCLAALVDDVAVVRRYHDERVEPDVVAEAAVFFLVGFHRLAFAGLVGAADAGAVLLHPVDKIAVDGEKVGVEADGILVLGGKETLAEAEVVDGIEQVGFAAAVLTNNAVDILAEVKLGILVAFEVGEREVLQVHWLQQVLCADNLHRVVMSISDGYHAMVLNLCFQYFFF